MKSFPAAVPEIPVTDIDKALDYYKDMLGFTIDWGGADGGIAGISKGDCRLFLTNDAFRSHYGNTGPVLIWLNLDSREDVDELHRVWSDVGARIISLPESKHYGLHEFTVADPDGNLLRVFYDFATPERGQS
jgi:predicted lactoylglutathione lyase